MGRQMKRAIGLRVLGVLLLSSVWILFTLYPNPTDLAKSVYRVFRPPINASLAALFDGPTAGLEDARAIDARVQSEFPYQYDWVTYNVPWYFPTVDEAFAKMAGDCKTRLVVLASILEAHGIPYSIAVSPTHIWVEYAGKTPNRVENPEVALFSSTGGGRLSLPAHFDLRRSFDSFWTAFWIFMPIDRKLSLIGGLAVTLIVLTTAGWASVCRPIRAGRGRRSAVVLVQAWSTPPTPGIRPASR